MQVGLGRKGHAPDSLPKPPEGKPCGHLDSSLAIPVSDSGLPRVNMRSFKPPSLWRFLQQQQETNPSGHWLFEDTELRLFRVCCWHLQPC